MTFVPLLVGILLGGFTPIQLLLLGSWTAAFLFFNVFGILIKARRRQRYWPATITYGTAAAAGALILLILRWSLWVWAPVLGVLFAWATIEIWRRTERSLGARVSAILASCLMMPVAYSLGSHPTNWHHLWVSTTIVALYFIGTVPYVKTLIRERGVRSWLVGSVLYHLLILAAVLVAAFAGLISWAIPAVWVVLLGRAWVYPLVSNWRERPLSPKFVGLSEFGYCALLVVAILW